MGGANSLAGARKMDGEPQTMNVDFLEAGAGPLVVLVHSSVSGARQWRRLIEDLQGEFHVRAVNLFGYGKTPAWPANKSQSLDDQAGLVEAVLPAGAQAVSLVGHSFGGAVAMKAAARLRGRVAKLALLEANPVYLLQRAGRTEAFAEAASLRDCIKEFGARGEWAVAAERFADYWGGGGSWREMPPERRSAFADALKPNFFEWDAVMNETTAIEDWARLLPKATLLAYDPNTVLPIREIVSLFRRSCPAWTYSEIETGGHMAPLTRPDLVNPIVKSFLQSSATDGPQHQQTDRHEPRSKTGVENG
jgi:pimeloyl-ACP methyl ester carboxylesterase